MSIRVMTWVWDNVPLKGADLLIMLALADYANDGGECWPSMKSIAQKARMTERGAQKIVRRLAEEGRLEIMTGGGRHGCNNYRIILSETPNEVHPPNTVRPRTAKQKPRTEVQKTPNRRSPEPSGTVKEPSVSYARDQLCTVLRPETADAYIAHRKAKRAPLTNHAVDLLVSKLADMPDPDAATEHSIMMGWTGIFPPKPQLKAITGGRQDDRRQFAEAHREYTRRLASGAIHRGPDESDPFAQ